MTVIKGIIFFLLALVVLLVVGGYFLLPHKTHVERTTQIDASPESVYSLINNFRRFNEWSPWAGIDPAATYRFAGPDQGLGAKMFWSSENRQVGSGSQEIIADEPHQRLAVALDFGGMGQAVATYRLEPTDDGTRVTWVFDGDHGNHLLRRFFGLFMERWIGPSYEKGLANLKRLAENKSPAGTSDGIATNAAAEVVTPEKQYRVDGTEFTGFLAYSPNRRKSPGVLVVHEWWGHNDYARRRAEMLAQLGYTAFALDMYGNGKLAEHPSDAAKFMKEVAENQELTKKRFLAALDLLKGEPSVNGEKIGAIGYCFGGAVVLNMAREGVDLDGVVSFHGSLKTSRPVEPGTVKGSILVLNGASDPFVTEEEKAAFKEEMDAAGVDYEFIDYAGVKHSFTNPEATEIGRKFDLPLEYNHAADTDSWQRTSVFLSRVFQ